jgi:hypothetical protein
MLGVSTRIQEEWCEWVATWFSEEDSEHDMISEESAQAGRVLSDSEHPQSKKDKPNLNETVEGRALDQPILEDHQTASISTEVAREKAREHLDHSDGIPRRPGTEEGNMLSAEGKQTNLDKVKQQLPVSAETQLNGENKEEGAMTRETVRKST